MRGNAKRQREGSNGIAAYADTRLRVSANLDVGNVSNNPGA